jgi:hypothetical protein
VLRFASEEPLLGIRVPEIDFEEPRSGTPVLRIDFEKLSTGTLVLRIDLKIPSRGTLVLRIDFKIPTGALQCSESVSKSQLGAFYSYWQVQTAQFSWSVGPRKRTSVIATFAAAIDP